MAKGRPNMIDDTWKKLSKGARLLAGAMARTYLSQGTVQFTLNDLREAVKIRSRTVILLLSELTSRGYGQLSTDDQTNPVFSINRPRFESIAQNIAGPEFN
jgi:hypothetical protein